MQLFGEAVTACRDAELKDLLEITRLTRQNPRLTPSSAPLRHQGLHGGIIVP